MKKHKTTRQGTRRALRGKKAAALALAVALWTMGGALLMPGVASASTRITINPAGDNIVWYNDDDTDRQLGKYGSAALSDGQTLLVGGTWHSPEHSGGYMFIAGDGNEAGGMHNTGYTLNVKNAVFDTTGTDLDLYGARKIYNGDSAPYTLTDNAVIITDSKFSSRADIRGGDIDERGTVDGCSVTIAGTLDANGKPRTGFEDLWVYAGVASNNDGGSTITNNAVNLYGAAAMEQAKLVGAWYYNGAGSAQTTLGNNALHLGGTKDGNPVNGVAISPWQGYNADGTAVTNTVEEVRGFDKIVLHQVNWSTTLPALKATGGFSGGSTQGGMFGGTVDISDMIFVNGTTLGTMTLLEGQGDNFKNFYLAYSGGTAHLSNTKLSQIVKTIANTSTASVTDGVTLDYNTIHTVSLAAGSYNQVNYSIADAPANLTFGNVAWSDDTPLVDHSTTLAGVSFAGVNVDTSNINFTNIQSLEANKQMTLVKDFLTGTENYTGTITGTKYKVGSTLQGEGKASLEGNNLIFHTDTTAEKMTTQEQTHNTVMGAEVGIAALTAGNDFIGAATEGLSLASNVGADGISSYAKMGGGSMRQETGSHIDVRTWNAILALGHQNKKERGTFEYGAFFEYGTGNYTTHNGDERGDGSARYTGGGLLAKYTLRSGAYVEGSLRAGTIHDDARNVLRDGFGNPYSYETDAPYFGVHIGVGKEFTLNSGNVVDVYGKYCYNRRNGVDFNAGGQYNLDAVTSQVLRVGARYTMNRNKWKFYAGAAYEHELDGKAEGRADGMAIRGADTAGGSFRGELGATMTPGENSPWKLDLNVTGFAGKKQGITGGMSVAFLF